MLGPFAAQNHVDAAGNPTGGSAHGIGIIVEWQDGPLGRGADRKEPNGAFVETLIAIAIQRLDFYQTAKDGAFTCRENALAITKLEEALHWLDHRTKRREVAGTEGTHAEDAARTTSVTTDRDDEGIRRTDTPGMQEKYLVLSEEDRAKGFVKPVRFEYTHVGRPGPDYPLRELTDEEQARYAKVGYVQYEAYPPDSLALGRFWTQDELDTISKGCNSNTRMSLAIAETYAASPLFYTSTYCVRCQRHLPVGRGGEFVWKGTTERVGT